MEGWEGVGVGIVRGPVGRQGSPIFVFDFSRRGPKNWIAGQPHFGGSGVCWFLCCRYLVCQRQHFGGWKKRLDEAKRVIASPSWYPLLENIFPPRSIRGVNAAWPGVTSI